MQKLIKMEAHKFSLIYDRLEGQPYLQDIIKEHYYEPILRDLRDEANDAKFHLLDTLNYAFKNARQHQQEIYGRDDEDYLLQFMRNSMFYEVIRNGKYGVQIYGWHGIIEQYYGNDFNDYFEYEYGYSSDDIDSE